MALRVVVCLEVFFLQHFDLTHALHLQTRSPSEHGIDLPSPKARSEYLIVNELPDEVLVYDLERGKAHCLNSTAALVWVECDGQKSIESIAASLKNKSGFEVDERVVWLALDQLQSFNLLDNAPARPLELAGMSRRQMARHIGVAALAAPDSPPGIRSVSKKHLGGLEYLRRLCLDTWFL